VACIYLLHFEKPYKHAKHYLGYTDNLTRRLNSHAKGVGARLTQVVKEQGIDWTVSRIWKNGTRHLERKLKNQGGSSRHCPICKQQRNA